jgi:hypothetical protein
MPGVNQRVARKGKKNCVPIPHYFEKKGEKGNVNSKKEKGTRQPFPYYYFFTELTFSIPY